MFQTITCVYAIEVMPTTLRAYLTSYVNMCWVRSISHLRSLSLSYLALWPAHRIWRASRNAATKGALGLQSSFRYSVVLAFATDVGRLPCA